MTPKRHTGWSDAFLLPMKSRKKMTFTWGNFIIDVNDFTDKIFIQNIIDVWQNQKTFENL